MYNKHEAVDGSICHFANLIAVVFIYYDQTLLPIIIFIILINNMII